MSEDESHRGREIKLWGGVVMSEEEIKHIIRKILREEGIIPAFEDTETSTISEKKGGDSHGSL